MALEPPWLEEKCGFEQRLPPGLVLASERHFQGPGCLPLPRVSLDLLQHLSSLFGGGGGGENLRHEAFYIGSGYPNTGPHVCPEITLTTELSATPTPRPHTF